MARITGIDLQGLDSSADLCRVLRLLLDDQREPGADVEIRQCSPDDPFLYRFDGTETSFVLSVRAGGSAWRVEVCSDSYDDWSWRAKILGLLGQLGDERAFRILDAAITAKGDEPDDDEDEFDGEEGAPPDAPPSNPGGTALPPVPTSADVKAWASRLN